MGTGAGRRGYSGKIDVREALFLEAYYDAGSKTKGSGVESALAAGYSESVAHTKWPRLLKKFGDGGFKDSLRAVGITKPYLAMKLRHILDHGDDKEQLAAVRMVLSNLGETTDQSQGGNTFNAPVMVIVGASAERMRALKEATYQPTREELEAQENARVEHKLQLLREGKLPPLGRIADGRVSQKHPEIIDVEAADVPNLDGGDAGNDRPSQA